MCCHLSYAVTCTWIPLSAKRDTKQVSLRANGVIQKVDCAIETTGLTSHGPTVDITAVNDFVPDSGSISQLLIQYIQYYQYIYAGVQTQVH